MQEKPSHKIKVLIVDDSLVSQRLYKNIIAKDNRLEIIGVASNGQEAIAFLQKNKPDVISMDLNMPVMDGMEATRQIMQFYPLPIVIASNLYDPTQQEMAIEVLEAGAVSILPKPAGPGHPDHNMSVSRYLRMLKSMAEVKVVRRRPYYGNKQGKWKTNNNINTDFLSFKHNKYKLLTIGASAGGPEGVKTILAALKPGFPLPVLIVQHIDNHFSEGYRIWLQSHTKLPVIFPVKNQHLLPGHIYLAPGGAHLIIKSKGVATLNDDVPVRGHKPSIGYLFRSAAKVYGADVIAVILSGMGNDGAEDLKKLKDLGALTFAQDEATCLVFGMPGEAVRLGGAVRVLPPADIVKQIIDLFN